MIMISFTNQEKIAIVYEFIQYYGNILVTSFQTNKQIRIHFRTLQKNDFEDPMITWSNIIEYSPDVCEKLQLTNNEILAMFAHEIGHILDTKNPNVQDDEIARENREIAADSMAQVLGLGDALASGLYKLLKSGQYPNEIDLLRKRICILKQKLQTP